MRLCQLFLVVSSIMLRWISLETFFILSAHLFRVSSHACWVKRCKYVCDPWPLLSDWLPQGLSCMLTFPRPSVQVSPDLCCYWVVFFFYVVPSSYLWVNALVLPLFAFLMVCKAEWVSIYWNQPATILFVWNDRRGYLPMYLLGIWFWGVPREFRENARFVKLHRMVPVNLLFIFAFFFV